MSLSQVYSTLRIKHRMTGVICFSLVLLIFLMPGCGNHETETENEEKNEADIAISSGFQYWEARNPDYPWLKLTAADFNGDNREDILIIYRIADELCEMAVIINLESGFHITNSLPAPVSDQVVSVFEMDGKPPVEFTVSGRKGVDVGSGVFRVETGELVMLFSSSYGACC